jgi:hypothetical protein
MTNRKDFFLRLMIPPNLLKISEEKFSHSWSLSRSSTPFMGPSDVIEATCLPHIVTVLILRLIAIVTKWKVKHSRRLTVHYLPFLRPTTRCTRQFYAREREIKTRQTTPRPIIIIMGNDLLFSGEITICLPPLLPQLVLQHEQYTERNRMERKKSEEMF